MADEDTAITEESQDSGDTADSDTTETEETTEPTPEEGDTSLSDGTEETEAESEEEEADPMIPKHRLDEEISKKKKLEIDKADLQEQLNVLTQIQTSKQNDESQSKKGEVVKNLKDQGYDQSQIDAIVAIAQEYGGGADVAKQVEDLKTELAQEKDRSELDKTVEVYSGQGIEISKDDIVAQMKEWQKDPDPRVQLQADLPYSTIVKLMRGTEINEKEVNASLSKKKKTSTKVDGGKTSGPKTPSEKKFDFQPGNPVAYSEALENEVLRRMTATE